MTRRERFEWHPGAPLPTDVPLLSTQIGHCVQHVPPGRWCNWDGLGDPLGIDGFMAGQLGLKLSRTPGRTTFPHDWPVPWHRIRTFDGKHKAPEFVSEAENIEIVAVTADWWERECRHHGFGRAWRIPGVAYAEERKFSIAQWVADEKRAGTWPW